MSEFIRRSLVIMFASLVAGVAMHAHSTARAADYWVTLSAADGEIAGGVNGFTWHTYGGSWNTYGSHCDANPGASFVAGAYCVLRFNVPAGLSVPGGAAGGGIANGTYRVGTPEFLLRTARPSGSPDYVSDAVAHRTTHGPYSHGWNALGAYTETGIRTSVATTTKGTLNTWFHHDTFTVLLRDPTAPELAALDVPPGWRGPGCHPVRATWTDVGSQLWNASVVERGGGAVASWQAAPGMDVVASGVGTISPSGCVASASSGVRHYATSAADRSGNVASRDFSVAFDVTPPVLGVPVVESRAIGDDDVLRGAGYRPVMSASVRDEHSGVASVGASIGGISLPARIDGGTVIVEPSAPLPLGTQQLVISATDRVGTTAQVTRRVTVLDETPPVIEQLRPFIEGTNTPVLDLIARDDRSGVDSGSWRVLVNGQPLVASASAGGVQVPIGMLVDGTHEIVVSVRDGSGNEALQRFWHVADGAPGIPQLSGASLTGIHVVDKPVTSNAGVTHRVRVVVARHGRPVAGRVELRSGAATVAFREIEPDGTADLAVTINEPRVELSVHAPAGAGLEPVAFTVECAPCADSTPRPTQPAVDAAGNGIVGPSANSPQPLTPVQALVQQAQLDGDAAAPSVAAAGAPTQACSVVQITGCHGGYPRNVIYYVGRTPYWNGIPLAESGAPLDRAAPVWRLVPIHRRAGTVRRTRSVAFRLWTNELSVLSIAPDGARRTTTIGVRRRWRVVTVRWSASSQLGRRSTRTRSGTPITLRFRVTAVDRNANRAIPRWVTVRTRA